MGGICDGGNFGSGAAGALGAGALATALICARVLRSLVRLETAVRALRLPAASGTEDLGADREQERYAQGVANILAYGTREMVRKRGEAQ